MNSLKGISLMLTIPLDQTRGSYSEIWYISTAVLPALPADSQSEMLFTSHYDLSKLVIDGK